MLVQMFIIESRDKRGATKGAFYDFNHQKVSGGPSDNARHLSDLLAPAALRQWAVLDNIVVKAVVMSMALLHSIEGKHDLDALLSAPIEGLDEEEDDECDDDDDSGGDNDDDGDSGGRRRRFDPVEREMLWRRGANLRLQHVMRVPGYMDVGRLLTSLVTTLAGGASVAADMEMETLRAAMAARVVALFLQWLKSNPKHSVLALLDRKGWEGLQEALAEHVVSLPRSVGVDPEGTLLREDDELKGFAPLRRLLDRRRSGVNVGNNIPAKKASTSASASASGGDGGHALLQSLGLDLSSQAAGGGDVSADGADEGVAHLDGPSLTVRAARSRAAMKELMQMDVVVGTGPQSLLFDPKGEPLSANSAAGLATGATMKVLAVKRLSSLSSASSHRVVGLGSVTRRILSEEEFMRGLSGTGASKAELDLTSLGDGDAAAGDGDANAGPGDGADEYALGVDAADTVTPEEEGGSAEGGAGEGEGAGLAVPIGEFSGLSLHEGVEVPPGFAAEIEDKGKDKDESDQGQQAPKPKGGLLNVRAVSSKVTKKQGQGQAQGSAMQRSQSAPTPALRSALGTGSGFGLGVGAGAALPLVVVDAANVAMR